MTFTDYKGIDPEISYGKIPIGRSYGVDFDLGLKYKIINGFNVYVNYRTPLSNLDNKYGLFSLDLNYCVNK